MYKAGDVRLWVEMGGAANGYTVLVLTSVDLLSVARCVAVFFRMIFFGGYLGGHVTPGAREQDHIKEEGKGGGAEAPEIPFRCSCLWYLFLSLSLFL